MSSIQRSFAILRGNRSVFAHGSNFIGSSRSSTRAPLTTATSNALHKLQIAVEDFRRENYAQELPSRCKKEMIQAADKNGDGFIGVDALTTLCENIGASGSVSREDIQQIVHELGDNNGSSSKISVDEVLSRVL